MKKNKEKHNLLLLIVDKLLLFIVNCGYAFQEMFQRYPKGSTIPEFKRKLWKRGYRIFKYIEPDYYCQLYPERTKDLVLQYYHRENNDRDKSFYLECLYSLKNEDLFYFLLKELEKYNDLYIQYQYFEELIAKCIYETRNSKWKKEYIEAFKEFSPLIESWPFLLACADFDIEEIISPTVKYQIEHSHSFLHDIALIALKKYKNKNLYQLEQKEKLYDFYPFEVTNQMIEDGKIKFMENKQESTILEFKDQIVKLLGENNDIIKICQKNPKKVKDLILNYYHKSKLISDKCFYIQCLTTSENIDLYPFLLKELQKHHFIKIDIDFVCTSLNCAFFYTRNIKYKEEYIKILENDKYINWNYMIIETCGSLQIKEAIPYLLKILENDKNPKIAIALNALRLYKDKKMYRDVFLKYSISKDVEIRDLAKKALKSIDKKC